MLTVNTRYLRFLVLHEGERQLSPVSTIRVDGPS